MLLPLQVACVADERYAPYCAAMLHSLLVHNAGMPVTVHYLHPPDFTSVSRSRFQKLVESHSAVIRFHEISSEAVKDLPPMHGNERIMWYRIFLPELLPEIERVLYLDADTLVVDRLDSLWQTDLNGDHLAAVRMVFEPKQKRHLDELGLPQNADYFNSGVLLMNLAAWRRDQCTKRIFEVSRELGSRFWWVDQDAMNIVFPSSCRFVHPRWNCQNSLYFWKPWANNVFSEQAVEEATLNPGILHFEGPAVLKPWHYLCPHPYREQYWLHLRASGFPVPQVAGVTLKNVLRKYTGWARGPVRALLHRWRPGAAALEPRS